LFKKLKKKLDFEKRKSEHFEDLFDSSVSELRFRNMSVDHLLSSLSEIEELAKQGVSPSIIQKVIQNQKERYNLDLIIHNHLMVKESKKISIEEAFDSVFDSCSSDVGKKPSFIYIKK